MTDSTPVVRVRDLRKSYGSSAAVDGVSFDIEAGETFALLGPNGAGKSTTIEILEGYRDRTGGDVAVLGVDPERGGLDWKSRLGIVLQSTGESGTATVREQIAHFAGFYPQAKPVDEVIAAVGLEEKAGARIKSLSGGQRRRVDVALAIVGRPELLFLDEPTTGFDPEARRQFWDLIRSLSAEGTSILLTTHYLDEAAQLSDRVAVIAGGRLIASGAPDEIGGDEARTPRVTWTDTRGRHDVRTSEPAGLVSRLVAERLAGGDAGEPEGLQVIRPTLEDVYLDLVAHATPADDPHRASGRSVRKEARA
ncbi:ABC transporter ATP-binding protein [Frigoribacterium sp. 2-23]|uniref:ABC transporter ATP-binding protein n=1 Tax=Frigoribacterium sp. 2-23 TaxID=3415006 RepID=UPI003C6F10F1